MIQGTEHQDVLLQPKPKRYSLRIISLATMVLVFTACVWSMYSHPRTSLVIPKNQVQIASVSRGDLVKDIAVQGKVVAANAPTLFSQAAGQIRFIKQPGEAVTLGDLLAVIESPELENEARQQKAALAALQSKVDRLQLMAREQQLDMEQLRNTAQINLQRAKRDLARAEQSIAKGLIRKLDYEIAQDALDQAEIEFEHAKNKVALAKDKLKFEERESNEALAQQTLAVAELERKLVSLKVTAPVTGQVGNWLLPQQSRVLSGSSLLTVIDLSQYEAEIYIPENYAAELMPGLNVEVTLNADTLMGKIAQIAPEVKEGNISARIRFADSDANSLRQNQRLTARILCEQKFNVLRVSRGDFVSSGGGRSVYKVDQDIAVRVPVELGALSVQWVEVVKGVNEGDQIIISNVQAFKDADRVRLN